MSYIIFYLIYFVLLLGFIIGQTIVFNKTKDYKKALSNKKNEDKKNEYLKEMKNYIKIGNIINIIFIILSMLLNYFLLVPLGKYTIGIIYICEIIVTIVSLIIINCDSIINKRNIFLFLQGAIFLLVIIMNLSSCSIFRAKEYRDIIPEIKTKTFSKEITPFDTSKAPIVTYNTAMQIADKKIGSISNIGSKAQVGDLTLQNVNGTLYWVAPLEYTGFFAWFNNKHEGTPYVMVNANNKECTLVEKHIKYQPEACFNQNLQRILYKNNPKHEYMDFTFEIDDKGTPYWTASTYINKIGLDGIYITGIALVNGETGEVKEYDIDNVPIWVDRIQPADIVNENLDNKGKYIHGFKFFNDNDKTVTSPGMGIVYNEGKCYYYTGVTSIGGDQSSLGFYLVDTRTMETTFYRMNGATEEAAMHSAEGKVQNLNYTASFPILLNVENNPTYLIALNDKNKLTKLYAMVNVQDYSIISVGENIKSCQSEYIRMLSTKNQIKDTKGNTKTLVGIVKRINSYNQENNTYYNILLGNYNKLFNIPCNQNIYLPITKEGDKVEVKFIDNKMLENINTLDFRNLTLQSK